MSGAFTKGFVNALAGRGAHVAPVTALEGLSPTEARSRPARGIATIWEQLAHIVYWQDWFLARLDGKSPKAPKTAKAGWPAQPARGSAKEWERLVRRFTKGLAKAEETARSRKLTARVAPDSKRKVGEVLLSLADHNSYHIGQIVTLRRLVGNWPPPSGGDTW